MTNSIVERVAQEIYVEVHSAQTLPNGSHYLSPIGRAEKIIRIILDSMKEPSEGMKKAGAIKLCVDWADPSPELDELLQIETGAEQSSCGVLGDIKVLGDMLAPVLKAALTQWEKENGL